MSHEPRRDQDSPFSLTEGGPFHHVLIRLGIRSQTSMVRRWGLAFVVWAPLAIGAAVAALLGVPLDPMLRDLSLHVRLLVALPLLLSSEVLLEQTARSAMASLYHGNFCDRALIDRIVERAERLRDAWVIEALLLGIAFLGGQLVLWSVFGTTGVFHGGATSSAWSFPRLWYATIAFPLFQFVMLRFLWRWLIWTYMLARISRLPLSVLTTHADFAGGLAPLARPVTGFSGFVLATSAILSAAWATQLLEERTTLPALLPMLAAFLLGALGVAIGPMLLLCGHLFRARRRTLAQYGDFMRTYTLLFHGRWIDPAPTEIGRALGTPDIQSLSDMGNSFQVISKTRVFPFGPRTVFTVWFAGLLPMIPLLASTLSVQAVLKQIVRTVLGGFPIEM